MKEMVQVILNAMVTHNPDAMPMAAEYSAWENIKPAALCMMESFRVFDGVKKMGMVFEDKVQNSVFFYADMDEGGKDTLLYMRYVMKGDKISAVDITILRSRGDAGFQYSPSEVDVFLEGWTKPIPKGERCTREELLEVASYIYTRKAEKFPYPIADDCFLMENGGTVKENPDYAEHMWGEDASKLPRTPDGLVLIPGDVMPLLSAQEQKICVIDEEQGVFGIWGAIDGYTCPYIESHETSSCFVPLEAAQMHMDHNITGEKKKGKCVLKMEKATVIQAEFFRFYGGALHGQHRFNTMQGIGARYPWD